jgi:hypothetical protein
MTMGMSPSFKDVSRHVSSMLLATVVDCYRWHTLREHQEAAAELRQAYQTASFASFVSLNRWRKRTKRGVGSGGEEARRMNTVSFCRIFVHEQGYAPQSRRNPGSGGSFGLWLVD